MKNFFYPRLALTNLKNNSQIYFPYLLTSSFTVMMFYLINFLAHNEGIENMQVGVRTIDLILNLGICVMIIFAIVFLLYINSFLVKRRKKEFALYNILGMEKKHIMLMMLYEVILTSVVAIVVGILFGIVFSQLMILLLVKVAGLETTITFSISLISIVLVLVVFIPLFLVTYVFNVIQIHLANPIELLRSAQSGEKEPKTKWLMTIIGVLALGIGYYLAIYIEDPDTAVIIFFVAVILVIVGTYSLFMSGSITILKLLKKNKRFYYQIKHFTAVSQLLYRMKQNAVGLASICILCTCILVMLSSTISLYAGIQDMVESFQSSSFQFINYGFQDGSLPDQSQLDQFYEDIQTQLEANNIDIERMIHFQQYSLAVRIKENEFLYDNEGGNFEVAILICMTIDEYNRAYNSNVQLDDQEILMSTNFYHDTKSITIHNQQYQIKEQVDQPYLLRSGQSHSLVLIMKNEQVIRDVYAAFYSDEVEPYEYLYLDYEDQSQEEEAENILIKCIDDFIDATDDGNNGGISFYRSSQYEKRHNYLEIFGSLLFLGVFLGVLFLMAAILIMYYKQLSEGFEDQKRFEIMQKVGMTHKEVKQTIRSQVLIFFFLPLIVSIIHMGVAFHMIRVMFSYILTSGAQVFIICTLISIVVLMIIYFIVYSLTARTYYKIVKN